MKETTTAIRGQWLLAFEGGEAVVRRDRWVIVEGNTIAAIAKDRPMGADQVIEMDEALVLPGLLNLHNHCTASVPFRGLSEDIATKSYAVELVYALLLPLGDLITEKLSEADIAAIVRLGLLELIKGGTTTLMEMFRNRQPVTFEVAREMGLRFYGAPYLFSSHAVGVGDDGEPVYEDTRLGETDLERSLAMQQRYDGTENGRLRFALGPHGADTCDPDLLREVRRTADRLGCLITIHLSQSSPERQIVERRYGTTPAGYLERVGLLGPDLLAAHCIYASEDDLALLQRTDTTVINCPRTFARGGVVAPFHRFAERGLRTVLGTDGYCMDFVGEMRAAGFVSKLDADRSGATSAWELIHAATRAGASALRRDDLGCLAPGAKADLIIVDMAKPHLQPVSDPIRTFVWNAGRADVWGVMVDGRMLVEDCRFLLADERKIIRQGAEAVHNLWGTPEAKTIIERARNRG